MSLHMLEWSGVMGKGAGAGCVQEGHRCYNCLLLKWVNVEEQRLQVGGWEKGFANMSDFPLFGLFQHPTGGVYMSSCLL